MIDDDERPSIEFESPQRLDEAFPERKNAPPELRRCSECGANSQARPASELTVIKHRHATQPLGHLRLYCPEHLALAKEWTDGSAGRRTRTGPVCPACHLTVPLGTGICESCGQHVS